MIIINEAATLQKMYKQKTYLSLFKAEIFVIKLAN